METILINYLRMQSTFGDPALDYLKDNGKLKVFTGIYVYDLLNLGVSSCQEHTEWTLRTFETKPRIYDDLDLFGGKIRPKGGTI